jgi:hypothetical protein
MPFVSGFLRLRHRPVDPGFGGGTGEHPDQGLPGAPAYPDQGLPGMEYPDQGLPPEPPGVWPPPTISHPIQPAPPGTPPGTIWPSPGVPSHPIAPPAPGIPAHPISGGGAPDQGLPSKTYWVVAGIPGVGWRYVAVDPSLKPDQGLPPEPARPAQPIQPTPEPRR